MSFHTMNGVDPAICFGLRRNRDFICSGRKVHPMISRTLKCLQLTLAVLAAFIISAGAAQAQPADPAAPAIVAEANSPLVSVYCVDHNGGPTSSPCVNAT